jgi:L-alanine-DL-glutamate epimerase-like enolase superfamily enzyme
VKMKVGREPDVDPRRLDAAREAVGDDVELFVDANGAFTPKQALAWAERYAGEWGASWLEEPVSSADFDGLRLVREQGPPGLDVAAGEYAYVPRDFANLLGRVDCLQADVTRAGGVTGVLAAGGLAQAHQLDVSAHCAPQVSAHVFCGLPTRRHLEYFHDHVRIERLLFDGALEPVEGVLRPDPDRPGLGIELKREEAQRWAV